MALLASDKLMLQIEANTKPLVKDLDAFNKKMMILEKGLMGAGLSFLFTGMAIKNFFQNILGAMFQTFLQVEGQTGAVNEKVNELLAAIAFLKFTLVAAFAETGVLDKWISRINSLVSWFSELDEGTKSLIVSSMIWAVIIGGLMMVVGQLGLAILGLTTLFNAMLGLNMLGWLAKLKALFVSLTLAGALNLLLALFAIFVLLPKLISAFGGFGNFVRSVFAGILKAAVLLVNFLVGALLQSIERIVNTALGVARFFGFGGETALAKIANQLTSARQELAGVAGNALQQIDVSTGAAGVRGTIINNNINVEGSADQGVIDDLINKIEERLGFVQGSPQS